MLPAAEGEEVVLSVVNVVSSSTKLAPEGRKSKVVLAICALVVV